MEDNIGYLNQYRREKESACREYEAKFLCSSLSLAAEQCFLDAEKWSYNIETLKNFRRYIDELSKIGILPLKDKVETLRRRESAIVSVLFNHSNFTPAQKKLRMHALIFLFRHLSKETRETIKTITMPPELAKIRPDREGNRKAATFDEVQDILQIASSISLRDSLVLEMIYQTEKSLQNILRLKCEDLNFEDRMVSGVNHIIDALPMRRLKDYIESMSNIRGNCPYIFISNQGNPIYRTQIQKILEKVNQAANLPYVITTKMIQRSKQSEKIN